MATKAVRGNARNPELGERRFFFIMALVMAFVVTAGFSVNLAMGRSSFSLPPVYHVHAAVFFSWLALYVAQNGLIAANNISLHRRLGKIAFGLVPMMVVLGVIVVTVTLRRTGGPFFFDQNEFLFANTLLLVLFGALVFAALRQRRYSGWHRRLMLVAMAILTGPGLGRLLPAPLMIPNAWRITIAISMIFPLIGMIADRGRLGRVHPAYLWGVGAVLVTQLVADGLAYSPWGIAMTRSIIAGSAGAARPMSAFLPTAM